MKRTPIRRQKPMIQQTKSKPAKTKVDLDLILKEVQHKLRNPEPYTPPEVTFPPWAMSRHFKQAREDFLERHQCVEAKRQQR